MNILYESAGLRIRNLREAGRYSREEFAEIAEISSKFLYEIETGQKGFSADTLYRISHGLGVTTEYILSGNQNIVDNDLLEALSLFGHDKHQKICEILKLVYELGILD